MPEVDDHPTVADLLVVGGDVVTMNAAREVLLGGALAIGGSRILALGSVDALRGRWPGAPELDARDCVITPGMINAHQHLTGDPLARSCIPDNLVPGSSIFDWSVPLHAAHTGDDDELSAVLTAAESVGNGVTTLIEAGTVAHPDRVVAGMRAVGVRGTVGTWGWDIGAGPFAAPADEVLDRQRQVLDAFPPGDAVSGWVTLIGHSLASDELLQGAADLARARGVGMTMHMSPTSSDPEVYRERTGRDPLMHLDALGVLGAHLLLAHGVWLSDDEVDAVLRTRTAIAYCPWAYLRLGQGVSSRGRHAEIVVRGGRVGLGCDATNAGDQVDILRAAALAAGLAKDTRVDPTWFGAHEAFEMATIGGAEAVGMATEIGSLEPGKQADVVVHDTTALQWSPRGDTALQLVWSADGRTVRDVIVAGRVVVRDGTCVTVDLAAARAEARSASTALFDRAGITVPHRWPHVPAHTRDAPPVGRLPGAGRLT
ncbi:MAG TPA: amidohydrolase family protein [Acidimicrobiia bacterium]|nr:amidohydrolase family protein [Acidimicrobiia bacterium]